MTDVPNIGAIGEKLDKDEPTVDVIINTGALHDEFIIHRIGLIPICMTTDEIENYEDNSLVIELNVNNTTSKSVDVRTSDFKAKLNDVELTEKKLQELFPPNKVSKQNILITRLRAGEHLHLKANIVKERGVIMHHLIQFLYRTFLISKILKKRRNMIAYWIKREHIIEMNMATLQNSSLILSTSMLIWDRDI